MGAFSLARPSQWSRQADTPLGNRTKVLADTCTTSSACAGIAWDFVTCAPTQPHALLSCFHATLPRCNKTPRYANVTLCTAPRQPLHTCLCAYANPHAKYNCKLRFAFPNTAPESAIGGGNADEEDYSGRCAGHAERGAAHFPAPAPALGATS